MIKIDRKAQMMDAGTALFESEKGFGTSLGQVKAEMKTFGKVYDVTDDPSEIANGGKFNENMVSLHDLPVSTSDCDLFLDFSTIWRKRYISCKFEDAGTTGKYTSDGEEIRRYAATFKEGNRSSHLRAGTHIVLILFMIIAMISGTAKGAICITAGILLILFVVFDWMTPSKDSQHAVKHIEAAIRTICHNEASGK